MPSPAHTACVPRSVSRPDFAARLRKGGGQFFYRARVVFDDHDSVRSFGKLADAVHDFAIAKGIAAILHASRATARANYGADVGMRTTLPRRREDVRDPIGIAGWPRIKGRDGKRMPIQWTASPQAGFSTNIRTWLPIRGAYRAVDVAVQDADPGLAAELEPAAEHAAPVRTGAARRGDDVARRARARRAGVNARGGRRPRGAGGDQHGFGSPHDRRSRRRHQRRWPDRRRASQASLCRRSPPRSTVSVRPRLTDQPDAPIRRRSRTYCRMR